MVEQQEIRPLILIICAYHKREGGERGYNEERSILPSLSEASQSALKQRRQRIYTMLRGGEIFWANSDENLHEFNALLVPGPDLGDTDHDAVYLPAIDRYDGEDARFYNRLGIEGKINLTSPDVHTLIVSGLYGLVTPQESIQCYSVPVEWNSNVQKIWRESTFLTDILLEYTQKHTITHIFDFTAREDYRDMVDWEFLREESGLEVRHCFSRMGAGNDALAKFGRFFNSIQQNTLKSALFSIPFDREPSQEDPLYARSVPYEWDGLPAERRRIPSRYGVLCYDTIPDDETRQVFESAEKVMKILYNAEDIGSDPGSIFFMYYGKGLEVLLHNAISRKIIERVLQKYPDGIGKLYSTLPPVLKTIFNDSKPETISLDSWGDFKQSLSGSHPIVAIARHYFEKNVDIHYTTAVEACKYVKKYRNPADHQKINSMEEYLQERKTIIYHINRCIFALYGDEVEREHYRRVLRYGTQDEVLEAIAYLEKAGDIICVSRLILLTNCANPYIRKRSIRALGRIGDRRALEPLHNIRDCDRGAEWKEALEAIRKIESASGYS